MVLTGFERIEKIAISGMPFVEGRDVYIKYKSEEEAKETALWMIANGVSYIGLNDDCIYVDRDDFKEVVKLIGYKEPGYWNLWGE